MKQLKKFALFTLLFTALISSANSQDKSNNFDHSKWDLLLSKHVTNEGQVNYKGIKNELISLDNYLSQLSSATIDRKTWSKEEQMAFWINAYNAFTVKLILDNYPLKSINDLNKPWDKKFFSINGKKMSLNYIEHEILRKQFNEPRIHFAIVCASYSCPLLLNKAYTGELLVTQLKEQTIMFLNDKKRNIINVEKAQLSQIFNWFQGDFTKKGSLIEFINQYSKTKITTDTKITFLKYNWSLNE